jgi:hypothetical protein
MGAFDAFTSGLGEAKPTVTIDSYPLKKGILEGIEPSLSEKIIQAQQAYKEKYGKELPITSGARSYAKQKELFERAKKGEPGIYMPTNPDIDKKEMYHTNAVDISADVPESFLNQFGLHRPLGKKDPVHTVLMPTKKEAEIQNVSLPSKTNEDDGFLAALQKGSLTEVPTQETKPTEETKQPTDTSKLNAFAAGVGGAISKGAGALEQIVGKGVGLVAPETGKAIEQHALEQIKKTQETTKPYIEANPITGAIGEVTGLIASPINKLIPGLGGPAQTMLGGVAKGAAQGAIANVITTPVTDENKSFLTEKLKDALIGGGAGAVVGGVAKAATSLAQPFQNQLSKVSNENVKILRDAGVPVDVAQATGSQFLNRTKAALNDNPFTAGKEAEFIAAQQGAYNKAIAKTMGEDATAITPDIISNAKNRLGGIYDDLYNRYGAKISGQVYKDLASIRDQSLMVLPKGDETIKNIVNDVINKASQNRSLLTGEQYQAQKEILDKLSAQGGAMSLFAQEVKETLLSGLKNSIKNPEDIALLKTTNKQYGNMKKIEDVTLKDPQGNVSPSLLSNSLATKGKRNAIYAEDNELAKLARAGKDILQNKTPNSGTIARLSAQAAPALVGGAVYGAYQGDIKSAAEGAALGYAAPKLAQMLLKNPSSAKYLEQGVSNKTLRSFLELPKKAGEVLPIQPGVVGASSLKELINLRNQGQ